MPDVRIIIHYIQYAKAAMMVKWWEVCLKILTFHPENIHHIVHRLIDHLHGRT